MSATSETTPAPATNNNAQAESAAPAPASDAAAAPASAPTQNGAPASPVGASPAPTSSNSNSSGATGSLYVGELDPTVTEAMLYEIFSMIGPVQSIRVCRDAVTRRSLGYAYVNYVQTADGERALESLNYSSIKDKPCRIMWSQRDPALRKNGAGNVFIKNLDEKIDTKALHDTFVAFGNILSCKVVNDDRGNSKGYGFVHYDSAEGANAAIENVNGMLLNEKIVYVSHHIPRKERQAKIDEIKSHYTNLYVKEIPLDFTEEQFRELFEKYGTVTSALLSRDDSGASRGFGFVNFEKHEEAKKAEEELHEKEFGDKKLWIGRAQKKSERHEELQKNYNQLRYENAAQSRGVNLYIKNVDDDFDEAQLRNEFSPYGTITSCKIMRDEKGTSKGFGFVCFSSPDEATKAVTELNGKMVGSKPLYVALAQPKEQRSQQIQAQMASRKTLAAAAGIPGLGYLPNQFGQPMNGYPQPPMGGRGGIPYGMQGPARPRYAPPGGMPGMMPYGQPMPPYGQYPQQMGVPYGAGGRGGLPGGPGGRQFPGQFPPAGVDPRTGIPINPAMMGQIPGQPNMLPNGAPRPQQQNGPPGGGAAKRAARPAAQPSSELLDPKVLADADPATKKQLFGEVLYPQIANIIGDNLAGKVTGMLLELPDDDLLELVPDDREAAKKLEDKVQEAIAVLNEAAAREGGEAA